MATSPTMCVRLTQAQVSDIQALLRDKIDRLEHHNDFCRTGVDYWLGVYREIADAVQAALENAVNVGGDTVELRLLLSHWTTILQHSEQEASLLQSFAADPELRICYSQEDHERANRIVAALKPQIRESSPV